jgi:Acyl-CoA dehydrogenases
MNLKLSAEDRAFREKVRAWIAGNLPSDLSERVRSGAPLRKEDYQRWARILGRQGWYAAAWPTQFGGPGWGVVHRHLFEEECALAGAPRIIPFGPIMVAPVIMAFGSPAQQDRHLPGIRSGETWWCQGYSEPGAGSDLASLQTRAERRGDGYVVNGQKTWTSYAQHGDWMFCLVRTSHEGKPQAGISFLLIDMTSPGITVRPIKTMGNVYDVNEVFFDNVHVPLENLVGEENKGWTCAKYLLAHERTYVAGIPRTKRELDRIKCVAKSEGLWQDQRFRDQVALLEVDVIALELMVLRVLVAEQDGRPPLDVAALLKIRGSELQQRCSELMMLAAGPGAVSAVQEAAAAGWQADAASSWQGIAAPHYFHQRKTTIYGGSNEIQRNIVAQHLFS